MLYYGWNVWFGGLPHPEMQQFTIDLMNFGGMILFLIIQLTMCPFVMDNVMIDQNILFLKPNNNVRSR